MNEKFLLNPFSSDNYTEYRVIMEQFGFSKGKFLLEYPSNWSTLILDKLDANSIGELKRKKAVEKLNKFVREMIPLEFAFSNNKSWLENAEILREMQENAAKIITDNPDDNQIDFEDAVIFGVDLEDSIILSHV